MRIKTTQQLSTRSCSFSRHLSSLRFEWTYPIFDRVLTLHEKMYEYMEIADIRKVGAIADFMVDDMKYLLADIKKGVFETESIFRRRVNIREAGNN